MRAVQITRFGGLEVLDVVDLPHPTPGDGQQSYQLCDTPLAELGGPSTTMSACSQHGPTPRTARGPGSRTVGGTGRPAGR